MQGAAAIVRMLELPVLQVSSQLMNILEQQKYTLNGISNSLHSDGDIQLSGGRSGTVGLVQICSRNAWGTVCDDSWDATDAQVVWNQLGFSRTGSLV